MSKIHVGSPEPVLFLRLAARAMEDFRARTGAYAAEWPMLDITFASGPYRVTDPGIRPAPGTGNTWQPKDSEYRYRIAEATPTRFLLQALDPAGTVVYEMEPGMDVPRAITR